MQLLGGHPVVLQREGAGCPVGLIVHVWLLLPRGDGGGGVLLALVGQLLSGRGGPVMGLGLLLEVLPHELLALAVFPPAGLLLPPPLLSHFLVGEGGVPGG